MKALLFILLWFQLPALAGNDTLPGSGQIAVRAQYGFVIAHRPTVRHLQKKHVRGFEAELLLPTNGCDDWQQPFLLPSYSLAYQYLDLGNPELLGAGHALTARMIFPLNENKNVKTFLSAGCGVGYVEKPYDRFDNYKNVAIGSHINAVVGFSYRASFRTGKYSALDAGISFTHFSNGSFRSPNLGINIPAAQIGYNRYFGKPMACKRYEIPGAEKKHIDKVIFAAGVKGLQSAHGLLMYGVSTLAVSRQFTLSHKSRLGGGVDVFYDRTLPWKLNGLYNEGLKESTAWRAGIHAGYELTAGRVIMLFQNGVYLLDNYDEDGFIYTKIGVEYFITKNLLGCFNLKSHFAKADFFEYGLGYQF